MILQETEETADKRIDEANTAEEVEADNKVNTEYQHTNE